MMGNLVKTAFYVSDNEDKFASIASRILNNPMKNLKGSGSLKAGL
jgi:hypothetical protein